MNPDTHPSGIIAIRDSHPTPYDGYTPLTSEGSNLRDHEKAVLFNDIPSYGQSSLNWTNDSTDYCADSPYPPS